MNRRHFTKSPRTRPGYPVSVSPFRMAPPPTQARRTATYGGLLAAVALMAAVWDGGPDTHTPGFPAEGWRVQWEGLQRML
jgi:hypothetical protein